MGRRSLLASGDLSRSVARRSRLVGPARARLAILEAAAASRVDALGLTRRIKVLVQRLRLNRRAAPACRAPSTAITRIW